MPVAIKEENAVAGTVTTFGGASNRTPAKADGLVTERLRAAGAVVVGKTNMPEFGIYPFTESRQHGNTRNPWDPGRTPGGSSGGTAAAVASGMVAAGIGGDGGGSIRIPSACCGLFGLKPTRGRVSSAPAPDLWCALGTVGPLTRTVLDSALVYDVIRGNRRGDRYTAPDPETSFAEAARLSSAASQRTLRIAWSTKPPSPGHRPDAEHVRAVEETAALLEGLGHEVFEIDPRYPDATAAFLPQLFRGVREEADLVEDRDLLEARTRQLLMMGRWATPARAGVGRAAGRGCPSEGRRARLRARRRAAHPDDRQAPEPGRGARARSPRRSPCSAHCRWWPTRRSGTSPATRPPPSRPASPTTGCRPPSSSSAPVGDEATLFALSAQIEAVRPWADRRPPL